MRQLQKAINVASGVPLALDGDLVRYDGGSQRGSTNQRRACWPSFSARASAIRHDLEQGDDAALERTTLCWRVLAMAD
jgi:hypothetical protein